MESIVDILMRRDKLTKAEAEDQFEEAKEAIRDGHDPEEILLTYLGLEPDYIDQVLDL